MPHRGEAKTGGTSYPGKNAKSILNPSGVAGTCVPATFYSPILKQVPRLPKAKRFSLGNLCFLVRHFRRAVARTFDMDLFITATGLEI